MTTQYPLLPRSPKAGDPLLPVDDLKEFIIGALQDQITHKMLGLVRLHVLHVPPELVQLLLC